MHHFHRQIIIISNGCQKKCSNLSDALIQALQAKYESQIEILKPGEFGQPKKILGREYDVALVDLFEPFDANAFGAVSGVIRGGGLSILLTPDTQIIQKSLFLQRFCRLLDDAAFHHRSIVRISAEKSNPSLSTMSTGENRIPALQISMAQKKLVDSSILSTTDQEQAVKAIIQVVKGHRRRPLLMTSDRGRGKSAALGIAAAQLIEDGRCRHISVCAPSKSTAAMVFRHACSENVRQRDKTGECKINDKKNIQQSLHFFAPDELLRQKIDTDLLLIDEAASIPLPMLDQFLDNYSRIVFVSTEHGYEGSGRGFATRFRNRLDKKTPGWKHVSLKEPIRWAKNDPLEQFTFDALLLDAEPVETSKIAEACLSNCDWGRLDKQELANNELQLRAMFGLLVAAHYQTKPSDLQQLLDDRSMRLFGASYKGQIIAVALLVREGGFEKDMAEQIFSGKRRLKGNLVAQALAANAGIADAPCLLGDRIVRIAVHPHLQRKGFGSALLKFVAKQSGADYISASFGATPGLLKFWKQAGFTPVHVGVKRDASSGAHSAIVLKGKTIQGKGLAQQAAARFIKQFPHSLADSLRDLEVEVVRQLLQADNSIELNVSELHEIHAFAEQQRSYENSLYALWKLTCNKPAFGNLSELESHILIMKILQKHDWKTISSRLQAHLCGKKQALALLRGAIKKLMLH